MLNIIAPIIFAVTAVFSAERAGARIAQAAIACALGDEREARGRFWAGCAFAGWALGFAFAGGVWLGAAS